MSVPLTDRQQIALEALEAAHSGVPRPKLDPADPGVTVTNVEAMVAAGHLPDATYGPALRSLYNRTPKLVDGYRGLVNSTWDDRWNWWITEEGRLALAEAKAAAVTVRLERAANKEG